MTQQVQETEVSNALEKRTPRLGLMGVDWIGKSRMDAIHESKLASVVVLCDPYENHTPQFCKDNNLKNIPSYEALLEEEIDGVIIATPNALHKDQALLALKHGKSVFCQKPLACTTADTLAVIETARQNNCLLMVDQSYRNTHSLQKIKTLIDANELGELYSVHMIFHTAVAPHKPWYYKPELSGGGCLMDLGVHMIDILYWMFPSMELKDVHRNLFVQGKPLEDRTKQKQVEDYASCSLNFSNGLAAQLSCSWNVHAGKDAIIEFKFYGTKGGATFRNVNGSFYDFKSEYYKGTKRQILSLPPDNWGGKSAVQWASILANKNEYRKDIEMYIKTARTLDKIYD